MLSACGGTSGNSNHVITPPPPTLNSVSISPSDPSIVVGKTQQFTATAIYSDGSKTDVTKSSTWVSSDSSATITATGLATGKSPGSPNIQATFGSITGLTILDITTTAAQDGLMLGQINPSIAPGATLQLIASADYTDGSSQTVTSSATWISSNSNVASVETTGNANPGLVTGGTSGTATITATLNGFPASATVTVDSGAQAIPLMDMTGSEKYLGFAGGLYGGNSDTVPAAHDADGKTAAAAIEPLDKNGNPSASGKVVFLGIGMSNATIEFSNFVTTAGADSKVNHTTLAIEDGAHGAVTACPWTVGPTGVLAGPICGIAPGSVPAENQYDRVRDTVLTPAGLTEAQVEVIWMKNANPDPGLRGFCSMTTTADCPKTTTATNCAAEVAALPSPQTTPEKEPPTEACRYEWQTGQIIRAAKSRYPNLKQVFFSTRIYAGYAPKALNPEPYSYEYGFSGQWLVEAQIKQVNNGGGVDPVAGDLDYTIGAWTAWSSYLWANGTNPRSDGLIWCNAQAGAPCNGEQDFEPDGTHPSSNNPGHDGTTKIVSGQANSQFKGLMGFFKTSPYTVSWFCASKTACP
jgi:hypothetical protein